MEIVRKIRSETLLIVVLCMAAFLVNNNALTTNGEEAKTIVTARDMVATGNWMELSMNGEETLTMPPLAAWVAACVEKIYPDNISAQRAVSAVLGTLWTLFFFGVARYMERRRGFAEVATIVFLTCYQVIYLGRMVSSDIYCISFMMGAVYFLMRLFYDSRYYAHPHKWRWALLAGLMMGLSFLARGVWPFYVILIPYLSTVLTLKRPNMEGRWLPLLLTVVVALITFGWYYAYLFSQHPEAVNEMLRSELAPWVTGSSRPWYYYWRFYTEMGVWAILALATFAVPYWSKRVSTKRPYLMAMLWLVVALVLLTLTPEKSMDDLVVLMPPFALAVASIIYYYLEGRDTDRLGRALFTINGYAIALFVLAMPFFIHYRMTDYRLIDFGTAVCVNILLVGICIYIAISTSRREMKGILWGVVALFIVAECLLFSSIGGLLTNSHRRSIGELNNDPVLSQLPIYYNKGEALRMELVYEAKRHIRPLDLSDEKAVMAAMPCLLMTQEGLAQELPASICEKVDTFTIGLFDSNRLPHSNAHYRKELVNHMSILRQKPNTNHTP